MIEFSVKPSRCCLPAAKPIAALSPIGPETLPRASHMPKLPNGTVTAPVHADIDGRAVVTLTMPPSVLRPNSGLCGPRTNSIWPTSSSSMFDELLLSCGTPSR